MIFADDNKGTCGSSKTKKEIKSHQITQKKNEPTHPHTIIELVLPHLLYNQDLLPNKLYFLIKYKKTASDEQVEDTSFTQKSFQLPKAK